MKVREIQLYPLECAVCGRSLITYRSYADMFEVMHPHDSNHPCSEEHIVGLLRVIVREFELPIKL